MSTPAADCSETAARRFDDELACDLMRYTIYEDPLTHKFALLALPKRFVDGDKLASVDTDQWFGSREEALAALPDLLNRDESDPSEIDEPALH
jgi:hypothetical protein